MKLKISLSVVLLFLFSVFSFAGEPLEYEIVGAGSGMQGTYLVKVFVVSKKNKPDLDLLKKCAVHGVLFKGFADKESRVKQKPLTGGLLAEQQHSDFFIPFFEEDKSYRNYADMVTSQYEVVKMAKKQYRIGATLSVAKDQLRKDLEQAGVVKSLGAGF